MDWIEITIKTTSEGVEPVAGLALMAGIDGLVVDDPKDIRAYLASPEAFLWDYVDESLLADPERMAVVRLYVGDHAQGRRQWEALREGLDSLKENDREGLFGSLEQDLRGVKEEDWENNWKAYFKPFPVGEKLLVKPTWEDWQEEETRIVLEIDPGSSFGTGQHQTTRLCMEFLEEQIEAGMELLDIGCGSGILMIAALLLGAGYATGVDVAENALRTTEENLRQNRISPDRYAILCGDLTTDHQLREKLRGLQGVHLITANIVADVILSMSPYFPDLLKPEGKLLVSGVIDGRKDEVIRCVTQKGFVLEEQKREGEWNALLFRLARVKKG